VCDYCECYEEDTRRDFERRFDVIYDDTVKELLNPHYPAFKWRTAAGLREDNRNGFSEETVARAMNNAALEQGLPPHPDYRRLSSVYLEKTYKSIRLQEAATGSKEEEPQVEDEEERSEEEEYEETPIEEVSRIGEELMPDGEELQTPTINDCGTPTFLKRV